MNDKLLDLDLVDRLVPEFGAFEHSDHLGGHAGQAETTHGCIDLLVDPGHLEQQAVPIAHGSWDCPTVEFLSECTAVVGIGNIGIGDGNAMLLHVSDIGEGDIGRHAIKAGKTGRIGNRIDDRLAIEVIE